MSHTAKHAKTSQKPVKILKGIPAQQVRKFRFHTLMIILSSIASVSSTFVGAAFYLHIVAFIPTLPSITQEAWDMFKGF